MTPNPEQSERLLALAARVEATEGPDRELDALIVTTLCPGATVSEYIAGEGDDIVFHAETLGIRNKDCCPWYTHSLDAAMTLIPIDLFPTIDFVTKRVWIRDAKGFDVAWGEAHGFAATVPLSICVAALRARTGQSTPHTGEE
ncbi:hypothetical protein [Novosphingobium lindaniclasticum]